MGNETIPGMLEQSGNAKCVCPHEIALAHEFLKGAVRSPTRRKSSAVSGLQRSVLERAFHSGVNLCETGARWRRSRCGAVAAEFPAYFALAPMCRSDSG